MKRYEFHSRLTLEEVFARLEANAKQGRYYGGWQEPETFVYARKEERFRLGYTGVVPARGFVPFCGTVCDEGTGSVITGGFSLLRGMGALFAVMGGVFWGFGVCFGGQPPVPLLLLTAAWLLILLGFFSIVQLVFFWNRRKMIVRFIENNLLK